MILWRISNHTTLHGIGGLKTSGRWHTRGHRVVYLSSSPSSALLEILVHLEVPIDDLPKSYKLLEIQVPDDIIVENVEKLVKLSKHWAEDPASTRQIGDSWLDLNSSVLLMVPSALAPHTNNFLMNTQHTDASRISVVSVSEHVIDKRLLR